jgi:5-(carboxyamino)imidazole ribonucleotide synthase
VVTFEFENVPASASAIAEQHTRVRPRGEVLHVTQHRLREKSFLEQNGFPVTPFRKVASLTDLESAAAELGLPGVLKTAGFGYDGKGQVKVGETSELEAAWRQMNGAESIYEAFVRFEMELSVIGARTAAGEFRAFPVFENRHVNHILDVTSSPARLPEALAARASDIARGILEKLEVVGLLTVEMFLTVDGRILVNELAPRPHNSGHLTIDASVTSQFEQQVRAICGLPLGATDLLHPAAMANLLGDLWTGGEPRWDSALEDPRVKLHLYGKAEPRRGRKMGHLTATGETADEAVRKVVEARDRMLTGAARS